MGGKRGRKKRNFKRSERGRKKGAYKGSKKSNSVGHPGKVW
jgi:hypothetical protein